MKEHQLNHLFTQEHCLIEGVFAFPLQCTFAYEPYSRGIKNRRRSFYGSNDSYLHTYRKIGHVDLDTAKSYMQIQISYSMSLRKLFPVYGMEFVLNHSILIPGCFIIELIITTVEIYKIHVFLYTDVFLLPKSHEQIKNII